MNLFAYGTLMWPEVLEAVIGRPLSGAPATLHGFLRVRIKEKLYPALLASHSGDVVEGILYRDLTEAEFQCLDRFEGKEYDRRDVCIATDHAQVYVLNDDWRYITDSSPWRPEDVQKEQLEAFCSDAGRRNT